MPNNEIHILLFFYIVKSENANYKCIFDIYNQSLIPKRQTSNV